MDEELAMVLDFEPDEDDLFTEADRAEKEKAEKEKAEKEKAEKEKAEREKAEKEKEPEDPVALLLHDDLFICGFPIKVIE